MSDQLEIFERELILEDGLIVSRWGGAVHARCDYEPLCGARPCESLAEDRLQVVDRQFPLLEFGDIDTLAWLKQHLANDGFYGLTWCPRCRELLIHETHEGHENGRELHTDPGRRCEADR